MARTRLPAASPRLWTKPRRVRVTAMSRLLRQTRCPPHRRTNAWIRSATTQVAGEGGVDLRVRRPRNGLEQRRGAHDLPCLAKAALGHAEIDPRFLERMFSVGGKAFDRQHGAACRTLHRRHARTND